MNGAIFLIDDNGELVEMREEYYDSEDILQELLARYQSWPGKTGQVLKW